MALELDAWLKSSPEAPDLEEAPEGWHKFFDSFTICGEGECIKTSSRFTLRESLDGTVWLWINGRNPSAGRSNRIGALDSIPGWPVPSRNLTARSLRVHTNKKS
jgi:hypothetical protein